MKKLVLAILAGMLLLMLYGTAMACPNPDGCDGKSYEFVRNYADVHELKCKACGYQFTEPHWGGTATCTERARCAWTPLGGLGGGIEYGELAPHSFTTKASSQLVSAATCTEAAKYYAQCDNCDAVSDTVTVSVGDPLGHDYSGAPATCTTDQICAREGCGAVLSAKGHDYSGAPATCTTDQVCAREGCGVVLDSAKGHDYSGAPATCTTDQVCAREGCGAVLDSAKGHDYSGAPATCTTDQVCAREGCGAVLDSAKGHDYSGAPATCTTDQICAREGCGAVLDEAKGHDYSGAAATCTDPQICAREGCGAVLASAKGHVEVVDRGIAPTCTATGLSAGKHCDVCGEILARQTILPMKGHAYQAVTTAATCTEGGYTKYTCANCQASYITNETKARGHHYGEWSFSEDGAHSALCRRTGCEHVRTVECEGFAWRLIAGDAAYDFTLCPVCGAVNDGARLSWVEEAGAEALTENLPRGEIVLRMGTLANGETVMSVGFEYSGALTQPAGEVKVTLSAALLEGYTLALLDAEGAETAISTTVEDGTLSFALDFTPVEGEVPVPVRVIRLIPAAESF